MQNVARELNLSDKACLLREESAYRLRWFTPETEVELRGHATLASSHVLWEEGHLGLNEHATFFTLSGKLCDALGCQGLFIGRSKFDYLVEVASEDEVRGLSPDMTRLAQMDCRGVIVTARGDQYDFISRFFAPAVGVLEDPVTGPAHCALGPYWAAKLGRAELRPLAKRRL